MAVLRDFSLPVLAYGHGHVGEIRHHEKTETPENGNTGPDSFIVSGRFVWQFRHPQQFLCAFFGQCLDFLELAAHLAGTYLCVVDASRRALQRFARGFQYGAEFAEFGFDRAQNVPHLG